MTKAKAKPAFEEVVDGAEEGTLSDEPATGDSAAAAGDEPAEAEEVVTGPRVKIEDGPFVSVPDGDQRERRLLLLGHNYEHVSDVVDQDEVVWVYRRM